MGAWAPRGEERRGEWTDGYLSSRGDLELGVGVAHPIMKSP